MKQKLIWLPEGKDVGATAKKVPNIRVSFTDNPKYFWLLPSYDNKKEKPELPYVPRHHVNAFLEDRMHDWSFEKDEKGCYIRYHGCSDGGRWALLVFDVD